MATYIPNATQTTEPVESRTVESAALEFRTLKASINERIEDVQDGLDTEIVNRIAGDANLQTQNSAQDIRLTAVENALLVIGEGGLPGTVYVQRFSGTGAQTAFTLNVTPQSGNVVDIYINGLYQNKDTFSVAGAVITFSEAPPAGADNIEVQVTVTIALGETDASLVTYNATTVEAQLDSISAAGGSNLVGFQQAGTGAIVRTAQDKMREGVSVKDFGAIGDGVADDAAAIQAAIDSGAKRVYFPSGTYYASQSIKLPHTGSYFRKDTGVTITGDGIYTILTRNNSTDVATANESLWHQRSFFSVYGSNNIIENLQFSACPIGIYFGQDPAKVGVELSHTSFNRMRNLLIQECGTGILSACAQGHYYNHYEAIHIAQSQIGVHFTTHSVWGSTASNNNRNTFVNVRASRCQVGFWLANGNTNSVYSFHCEGCGVAPTNNAYSSPAGLPGGLTTAAHIVMSDNNSFINCFHESCDFYLYQSGLLNSYIGCLYRVNEEPAKSVFAAAPNHWISRSETWLSGGAFASLSNMNASAFPDTPAGAAVVRGTSIFAQVYGGGADIRSTAIAATYARDQIFQLGGVSSGGSASFTLWKEDVATDVSSAALFDVSVIGNSQANSLAYAATFKVVALRNSARTLTRYYLYGQVNGRATGSAAGDSSEPLTPSMTVGGASGKDLIVTITAPARTFENVSAVVRRIHSRPA